MNDGPTPRELRIALIGPWLARFHDLFPKFDRRPEDLMGRADDFAEALDDLSPDSLAYGFQEWRKYGKIFPVPSDIRYHAEIFLRNKSIAIPLPPERSRFLPAPTPEEQDEETKRLRAEFQEMLAKAKRSIKTL